MAATHTHPELADLIAKLDAAVNCECGTTCCNRVKDALEEIVQSGQEFLPEALMKPADGHYARHLIHTDPNGRWQALAMVWDKGQGTKIHDHANMWCCECVYRGRIKVVSYRMEGEETDPLIQFHPEQTIYAGPGEAGALIPPFDHHTIENDLETPSVTIHVYGGEMTWCHVFEPVEGGFTRVRKELKLDA